MKTIQEKITWYLLGGVWVLAAIVYQYMPDKMATHWNAQGVANGYSGKVTGVFLMPIIMTLLQGLFIAIPNIDPLRENIIKFKKQFFELVILIELFMAYIFGLTLLWNNGIQFSMNTTIAPAFAILFYGLGAMFKDIKRNYFIGIRTPWTLSSDAVWDETHQVGEKVFKAIGLTALLGIVFPKYFIVFLIVPISVGTIGIIGYSYWVFRNKK